MKRTTTVLILMAIYIFISCSENTDSNEDPKNPFSDVTKGKEMVEANNKFALQFIEEAFKTEESNKNIMLSPVSLSLALGMTYNGAETSTKEAFEKTLCYEGLERSQINDVNKNIIDYISSSTQGSIFEVGNSIWANTKYTIKEEFIALNKDFYSAEVDNLDFTNPASVDVINNWVSQKTYGKIPTILDKVNGNALLYLINALYFKADWKTSFNKDHTKDAVFYSPEGEKQVKMMKKTDEVLYTKNSIFSSIQLPYKEEKYMMTIFLPEENKTVDDVLNYFKTKKLTEYLTNYKEEEVDISIPKFKFAFEKKLNQTLQNLGLGIAFTAEADFSGMTDKKVKITLIKQKTFIDVNEEGTEAAAVTVIGIETTAIKDNISFTANKPFVFFITEKETNSICFAGRISTPEYEEQ
ncbi:serpin family protein [Tenacibaculum agarivorans]|uniref:serpin family protein n=1 Tax=Tenacibaculum agarivorans TaxID=1908389 RepID=UPI00094B962B|nr:serpin family protein [Tenacibaculum agarivorans]